MLIAELIDLSHWEAAHLFIEALSTSGASIPSLDIVSRMEAPPAHGTSSEDKRMIFSSAYRSMVGECDDDATTLFMRIAGDPFVAITEDLLKDLSDVITQNLDVLSRHYGVQSHVDPRRVVRRGFLATG
jgi:hypothetical protein